MTLDDETRSHRRVEERAEEPFVWVPAPPKGFIKMPARTIGGLVLVLSQAVLPFLAIQPSWVLLLTGCALLGIDLPMRFDARRRNGGSNDSR